MNLIGKVVNGYEIVEFINDGGFGVVYKAEKEGKLYALKLFREAYVLKEYRNGGDNRIQREIDILKSANHKSLVNYVDNFVTDIDGSAHHFLVMEFIDGTNLRTIIDGKGKLDEKTALQYFNQVLDGLEALHHTPVAEGVSGVVHRDLKPENILIDGAGQVKVSDFGISKIIDFTSITSTGDFIGTSPYMSPEQIVDSKHVDRRSDVYALGVLLYEMLTGQHPHDYQSEPELIDKIKNEPAIPPRRRVADINNETENVILRCLEKQPYGRFSDVAQLRQSLNQKSVVLTKKKYDLTPRFVLRLYDDKSTLEKYLPTHQSKFFVEFPANLADHQKGLLKIVRENKNVIMIVDPATVRLAYDTFSDVEGLKRLPYAREDFQPITPDNLKDYKEQKEYVKKVLDTEAEIGADILLAPFHYTHNSNISLTTANPHAEWFDLDVKLLKEAIDYRDATPALRDKPLYAGICVNHTSLSNDRDLRHILNTFSIFDCDGYMVYVDCIDENTSRATLSNYITLLRELQLKTGKPVIAARVNGIGLGLLCAGVAGFTSGAARFETFNEDLYKVERPSFNLYERYYYPTLMKAVAILRKDPARFDLIRDKIGICTCRYCGGKDAAGSILAANNKLHFLEMRAQEVAEIAALPEGERIGHFIQRISTALDNYALLTPSVFKPSDYAHLNGWKDVFQRLK
ncbi:MAG: serine/threonine protein kinase [Candidatus Adlerbacteria bacterium]|nr:serine/threonine protein kinase [Candidatus Adlerbacteria bacterium]